MNIHELITPQSLLTPVCFGHLLWPSSGRCFYEGYNITNITTPIYKYKIQIQLFVLNVRGYDTLMCCVGVVSPSKLGGECDGVSAGCSVDTAVAFDRSN
jgi:hypothetical protein